MLIQEERYINAQNHQKYKKKVSSSRRYSVLSNDISFYKHVTYRSYKNGNEFLTWAVPSNFQFLSVCSTIYLRTILPTMFIVRLVFIYFHMFRINCVMYLLTWTWFIKNNISWRRKDNQISIWCKTNNIQIDKITKCLLQDDEEYFPDCDILTDMIVEIPSLLFQFNTLMIWKYPIIYFLWSYCRQCISMQVWTHDRIPFVRTVKQVRLIHFSKFL